MKISKVLNNNAVSTLDESNQEIILLGKGLGFQKKIGDDVDESNIEQVFKNHTEHQNQLEKLIKEIPYEILGYAEHIISDASKRLNKKLNEYIYVTLTDHLNYAIERAKDGIHIKNTLMWEIQKYYKDEYQIGLDATQFINEKEGLALPDDEAGFIALHIVNAEMEDMDSNQSLEMTTMIKDILNIVRYTFDIEYNKESIAYDRFVRHVKFFVQRGINNQLENQGDPEFFHDFNEKYPREYSVAMKIKKYMESKTNIPILEEELMYLTLHILIITRNK
ncbi:MAG TPA: PRD domain-containing protein [Erysipelothrix sp.]|jgi:beta-glucoside operon transcriptional antiterminator|nr:PRD domain-containing protein [Erysipelothrix sp.]